MDISLKNNNQPKHKTLISVLILFQLIVIVAFSYHIYQKLKYKPKVLGDTVVKSDESSFMRSYLNCDDKTFKNYCTPIKNTVWEEKPSWLPYSVKYYVNSNGFFSTRDYNLQKDNKTFRILALGDSHTYGLWVDTDQNYPSQLEKKLNEFGKCNEYEQYEVLNLSSQGDDPAQSVYRYNQIGVEFNPDLIIWYIKNDDFVENKEVISSLASKCFDKIKNPSYQDQFDCSSNAYTEYYKNADFNQIRIINSSIIRDFSNSVNHELLFFTYKDENPNDLTILKSLISNNVYLLNNLNYKDIQRFEEGHPNAQGYETVAEDIKKYIVSDILKCN